MYQTTVHDFGNFINRNFIRDNNFVWDYLNLNDIDWNQMIKNSWTKELDLENPRIEGGKSLLQVCIENENTK